jgi:phosphatidylglycerophosphate synthase
MNIATTRTGKGSLSIPNILTCARIAAIPVVIGCIYAQSIADGPLWLRWVAVAVFIAAGITDYLDGYYARVWNQQSAVVTQIGLLLLWISAIFTIYTGWDYFRHGIHHVLEEDGG